MAKLIVSLNGVNLREYHLEKERTTIGRHSHNDIVLDERVVSGEHAAVLLDRGVWLTDLGSTNGTEVNTVRVGKLQLKHDDIIKIGSHELRFVDESVQDFAATVILQQAGVNAATGDASIKILSGPRSGEIMPIKNQRTALGRPGSQAALILQQGDAHALLAMDKIGEARSCLLNGREVGDEAVQLSSGDIIEIADVKLEFISH